MVVTPDIKLCLHITAPWFLHKECPDNMHTVRLSCLQEEALDYARWAKVYIGVTASTLLSSLRCSCSGLCPRSFVSMGPKLQIRLGPWWFSEHTLCHRRCHHLVGLCIKHYIRSYCLEFLSLHTKNKSWSGIGHSQVASNEVMCYNCLHGQQGRQCLQCCHLPQLLSLHRPQCSGE